MVASAKHDTITAQAASTRLQAEVTRVEALLREANDAQAELKADLQAAREETERLQAARNEDSRRLEERKSMWDAQSNSMRITLEHKVSEKEAEVAELRSLREADQETHEKVKAQLTEQVAKNVDLHKVRECLSFCAFSCGVWDFLRVGSGSS